MCHFNINIQSTPVTLVKHRMLIFIKCKLGILKQIHIEFMDDIDVRKKSDFYQVDLVCDLWNFKTKD
jgi:hypothetical protein